jgi:hypothetical protein
VMGVQADRSRSPLTSAAGPKLLSAVAAYLFPTAFVSSTGAHDCQWPSSSPQLRPRISPLVAIFSPRWWPRISPPTDWLVFGGLGQGLDPLAGGGLRESVAVLAVGDQDVRVVKEPFDGRGGEAFGHQFVES